MNRRSSTAKLKQHALMFSALGDETRLGIIANLCKKQPQSIAELTRGTKLTRQAVRKHLSILESASLIESVHMGRETHFEIRLERLTQLKEYFDVISQQWDGALERLKMFVE